MTIKKLTIAPGVNREVTWYSAEGRWYDCENVRFRAGYPEKIGGWVRLSSDTFLGVCRSLNNWATLTSQNLVGLGTNVKFYIESGGVYYDITPVRETASLTDPFSTTNGSAVVLVTDVAHGGTTGDYVVFSGASAVGGLTLNGEFEITVLTADTYNITAGSNASGTATGGGAVTAEYLLHSGASYAIPLIGWGAGGWGMGPWGVGTTSATTSTIGMWSQYNFGEDLIFAPRYGPICIWDATDGLLVRGTLLQDDPSASDVPEVVLSVFVSDVSRFVFAFGCSDIGESVVDPMLVRWSDQEDPYNWTPDETNQAGSIRLSNGSQIVAVLQSRQEILTWTDSALYSFQYLGAPDTWAPQLVGEHISIVGPNAAGVAQSIAYWMGFGKFYKYDGTVTGLNCDVLRYVFSDFNYDQKIQVCCAVNEAFDEVWWFYPSAGSLVIDRYVAFNYADNAWSYGTVARTAWLDSLLRDYPIAATYSNNLVYQENGVDDNTSGTPVGIPTSITTGQFDIDDGDHFSFIWRVLPDFTFVTSDAANPTITLALTPFKNSGSGANDPTSVGGQSSGVVTRTVEVPVEEFTGQVDLRIRGRQLALGVSTEDVGIMWQLGSMRLDIKPDGRR